MKTKTSFNVKLCIALVFIIVALVAITACSSSTLVRSSGTLNLGDLPSDMLYVNGTPQIFSISTQSNEDVVVAYRSTDGRVVAQMYGCPLVSMNCVTLDKQGRYEWNIPGK